MKTTCLLIALCLVSCAGEPAKPAHEPSAVERPPSDEQPAAERPSAEVQSRPGPSGYDSPAVDADGDGYYDCPAPEPWGHDEILVAPGEGLAIWPNRARLPDGWDVVDIALASDGLTFAFKQPQCFLVPPVVSIKRVGGDTIVSLHGVRGDVTGRTERRYDFHGESWFGLREGSPSPTNYSIYKNYDETNVFVLLRGVASEVALSFTPDLRLKIGTPTVLKAKNGK